MCVETVGLGKSQRDMDRTRGVQHLWREALQTERGKVTMGALTSCADHP